MSSPPLFGLNRLLPFGPNRLLPFGLSLSKLAQSLRQAQAERVMGAQAEWVLEFRPNG